MLANTFFDDEMITCPDCHSPEKYEMESVSRMGSDGKIRTTYTYRCTDCGRVYDIRETKED